MLWNSNKKLSAKLGIKLLEGSPKAYLIINDNGEVLYKNKTAQKLFMNFSHPLEFFITNAIKGEYNEFALERLESAAKENICEEVGILVGDKKGVVSFFNISISSLEESLRKENNKDLMLWEISDNTDTRALGSIYLQERKDLSDFIDFSPIGMYLTDENRKITYANATLIQWLGYSNKDTFISDNKELSDIINGEIPPLDKDNIWRGELSFKSSTGAVFQAFVSEIFSGEDNNKVARGAVIRHVIPEREREHKFKTMQEQKRLIFEDAPIGIAFIDVKRRILEANNYLSRLIDTKKEKLNNLYLKDIISVNDYKDLAGQLLRVQSGEIPNANMEVRLKSPDSEDEIETAIQLLASPCLKYVNDIDIEIEGLVIHFLDKAEKKQISEHFAQSQRLQAMGRLAGGVAHDFNNILTAIIGYCDLLLQKHNAGDSSYNDIMQIRNNSQRAALLAGKLLAFSRTQAMRPQKINITNFLASDSLNFVHRLVGENVKIEIKHGTNVGYIWADTVQMDQVIMNLVINARDAMMPKGGQITVSTNVLKIEEDFNEELKAGEYITIIVKDEGCGIKKENIAKIFEPFFTTKKDSDSGVKGTGLGLATVYGIVKQLGGCIDVKSKVNLGTEFIIYLPRYENNEHIFELEDEDKSLNNDILKITKAYKNDIKSLFKEEEQAEEDSLDKEIKILLVEDEDSVRMFASRALRGKGYSVTESDCGESALKVLEEKTDFDLVITDMMMPGIDGLSLTKIIKEKISGIKVILVSGYSEDIAKGKLGDVDNVSFLAKPFSLKDLISKVISEMKS